MTKKSILRVGVLVVFVASFLQLVKGGKPKDDHDIVIDYQPVVS